MRNEITNLYDIAYATGDDLTFIACLIQTIKLQPNKKIVNDLEELKLDKYSKELDTILCMRTTTLKDLKGLFEMAILDYNNANVSKRITKTTTLIDLIEEI